MSKIKKLLALTLALAMVLSVSAFAGSYKVDTYKDAADINADCEDAIELMYALDIMAGDEKGNFRPEATITRAEVAKMIYVILNKGNDDKAINYKGAQMFSDVNYGDWYEGYVNFCAATKLVQGRGDGTFAPNAPVTTAEVAKMLLTAIGYSAEDRGYTGANWAQNVLSDANIVGLLTDYNTSLLGNAPRQWVAVMFENALTKALTYFTMAAIPGNGLLTSNYFDETNIVTFGNKYYGIAVDTAVAIATKVTSLDGTNYSSKGIEFSNGWDLEDTGLTVDDLGQEYKIITVKGEVVSIRNTGVSVVAEALLRDVAAKTLTGTDKNEEANKYEFTVADLVAKMDEDAQQIVLGQSYKGKVSSDDISATDLYKQANGKTDNIPTEIKAIDADDNGTIDYVIYTVYEYAKVTSTGTSRAYGDYVTMELADKTAVKYNGKDRLYVDDVISGDDLAKKNYVKFNGNHETGKIDVEVLPVAEETLDRVTNKGTYTIGGEVYVTSDLEPKFGNFSYLVKGNVGETYVIAVDGDMLVVVAEPDEEPTTLEEINAQLCVVTDVTDHYYTGWDKIKAVEIMTIDNEVAQYVLEDQDVVLSTINVIDEHACGEFTKYLYVFSIDDDKIELVEFAATEAGLKVLDENEDVINGVWTGHKAEWKVENEIDDDALVLENTYFVGTGEGKDFEVKAMTLEELEGLKGIDVHFEGLYDCGTYVNTMVAGYIAADEWVAADDEDDGYLYLNEEVYFDKADEEYMAEVTFADGTTETIVIANDDADELDMYTLYGYTYSTLKDEYTLTEVKAEEANVELKTEFNKKLEEIVEKFEIDGEADELVEGFTADDEIYVKETGVKKAQRYDLTDCVIVVKNITLDLDETEEDTIEVTYDIEFVSLEDLKEMETIFNEYENDEDVYYSDFTYEAEDIFYVEVYRSVNHCHEGV